MILVDTSIWISHFRDGKSSLPLLLEEGRVLSHPFITGELACGNLRDRNKILSLMKALPQVTKASHSEVLKLIELYQLMGIGLGYIDIHLLASTFLSSVKLWTRDRRLKETAQNLGISFD